MSILGSYFGPDLYKKQVRIWSYFDMEVVLHDIWEHQPDMRKSVDARKLSAEVLVNCGIIRYDSIEFYFYPEKKRKLL